MKFLTVPMLQAETARKLNLRYILGDGREVDGQSLAFIVAHLRSRGFTGPDAATLLRVGFAIERGGRLGVECDVVYRKEG